MANHLEEITDRQWSLIDMLVGDHDELLAAAKSKRPPETTMLGDNVT